MNHSANALIGNIEKVIVGKGDIIKKVVVALFSGGHILLEDVPGTGKTKLASALARSVNGKFNRIQLTPDIMPSDIVGFYMINPQTREFEYRQGAAVCNFLLADEINRASPKTQSSLLEVMEEGQISLESVTHALPRPFMVLATQNPIETYGTYHLPEAQMDRFLLKLSIGYPNVPQEMSLLNRDEEHDPLKTLQPVLTPEVVIALQKEVGQVMVSQAAAAYIMKIVTATRANEYITLGVSPRGSIALARASKALAYIEGRNFVTPDDIRNIAPDVLSHRIILSTKGKTAFESDYHAVTSILSKIAVPIEQIVPPVYSGQ